MTRASRNKKSTKSSSTSVNGKAYVWQYDASSEPIASVAAVTALLLRGLGINQVERNEFFAPSYDQLHDSFAMSGVEQAALRIEQAIAAGQHITIYGDYDIDGISATALLLDTLSQLGARAEPYIPDRFEEGYGLNATALKKLKDSGVNLIVSVDCGITAAHEVQEAASYGLDVIITDHHTVPAEIPKAAVACINPRLPGDIYPFKDLAGVGVAFKLASALVTRNPSKVRPGREKWLLDLVALGSVCDVVPLTGENRALVRFGLTVLRKSPRRGIRALAEASGVELAQLQASDLGFRLGPRLNAAGRLEHAAKALELLTTEDTDRAKSLAEELSKLNHERQQDTLRIYTEAMEQSTQYSGDAILVLSDPNWSHGIVGLVASRVSEALHKPTIILQELDGVSKGSARSVGNFSIINAISAASSHLERFGGHAFAAGMTLSTTKIPAFRGALNQYAARHKAELGQDKALLIQAKLAPSILGLDLMQALREFEPFGNGNKQPVFSSLLEVVRLRPVGSDLKHLQLGFMANTREIGAIAFNAQDRWPWLQLGSEVEVAFRLGMNVWQGVERLQLEVVDIRPAT